MGGSVRPEYAANNTKAIKQARIARETLIIDKALSKPSIEEARANLKFYQDLKLIQLPDNVDIDDLNIPVAPQRVTREFIENSQRIILVDNIERHYKGIPNSSNADDIWKKFRKDKKFQNNTLSLVINDSWKQEEVVKALMDLYPRLIVIHLNCFLFKQGYHPTEEEEIWKNDLIPLIDHILKETKQTKILLYTRKVKSSKFVRNTLGIDSERIGLLSIGNGKNFGEDDIIDLLSGEVLNMLNL